MRGIGDVVSGATWAWRLERRNDTSRIDRSQAPVADTAPRGRAFCRSLCLPRL